MRRQEARGGQEEADKSNEAQQALFKTAYGLRSDLALLADFALRRERQDGATHAGLAAETLRLKYRFLRKDLGPLDTWRASFLAGAELPGMGNAPGPVHVRARFGAVTTAILGRNGLNGEMDGTVDLQGDDELALNAAYLYRLAPAEYAADTRGAWYLMLESLNLLYERGAYRADLAPGLLYEAVRWAAEASVRLPVTQHGSHETEYELAFGLRYLW